MHVQRIEVRETNCYLLRSASGAALIDRGPPGGAETVAAAPREIGIQPSDVRLILVTHDHLDHHSMTARHKMPFWIFVGATIALAAVTLLGVLGGELLTRFIPETTVRKIAAALFVGMGLPMSFDALQAPFGCLRRAEAHAVRGKAFMDLHIRPMRDSDVEDLVQLGLLAWEPVFASLRRILGPEIYHTIWPEWRRNQREGIEGVCRDSEKMTVWVAEVDGAAVGFLAYQLDSSKKEAEVMLLAVHPDYQNHGVGTELNRFALERMKESGMEMAKVETGGDPSHAPARRSYEKAGYTALPLVRYFKKLQPSDPAGHLRHPAEAQMDPNARRYWPVGQDFLSWG